MSPYVIKPDVGRLSLHETALSAADEFYQLLQLRRGGHFHANAIEGLRCVQPGARQQAEGGLQLLDQLRGKASALQAHLVRAEDVILPLAHRGAWCRTGESVCTCRYAFRKAHPCISNPGGPRRPCCTGKRHYLLRSTQVPRRTHWLSGACRRRSRPAP